MHPYPHRYIAAAAGGPADAVEVTSPPLPGITTAPPPEFDGPGGLWSPETLLCASIADCFVLTFRSVSRAARFEWLRLECRVEGTLERIEHISQFTRYTTYCTLTVPQGADAAKARDLLERAERGCLIANSLRGPRSVSAQVIVASPNRI
jgi:organic hydroperoxide reductase OsmC/OhrA